MRIDSDLQPMGPERMMQRLQQFEARMQPNATFQIPGGASGLTGNLPGSNGFAPLDPKVAGLTLTADQATPQIRALIEKAANENSIDPDLLDAVVAAESSYDPRCTSTAGAMGLAQLMPGTVKDLGISNPYDPEQSLQGGARYLSQMLAKYNGRKDLALAAYNAGPGNVDHFGGKIPPYTETQKYVSKVLSLYELRKTHP